jgi:hypothetical protein
MAYFNIAKAVKLLAADITDQEVTYPGETDVPTGLLAWRKRERAFELLDAALLGDKLAATAHLASGEFVQLTSIDWTTASLRWEIIIGGVMRRLPEDGISHYEGAHVLLHEAAFEAWRPKPVEEKPATSEARANPSTLREPGRRVLAELAKLKAAGRQIDNLDKKGKRKLRRKLRADTGASHQTIDRCIVIFLEGRRTDEGVYS